MSLKLFLLSSLTVKLWGWRVGTAPTLSRYRFYHCMKAEFKLNAATFFFSYRGCRHVLEGDASLHYMFYECDCCKG